MKQINSKRFDLLLLSSLIVLSRVLSLLFNASFFFSTILFFGLPAIYLTLKTRDKKVVKKALIFSSLALIPLTLVDILGVTSKSWFVPSSVFPSRLFGIIPFEDLIWAFLLVYIIILFYEYFLDRGRNILHMNKTMLLVLLFFTILLFTSIIFLLFNPQLLFIPYFYIYGGVVFIIVPMFIFLFFYPKLIIKFVKVGIYFFSLGIIFELTGLRLNQWQFPATEYIGWIILGRHRFPIEELVFWLILFSSSILSYYEYLYDDKR